MPTLTDEVKTFIVKRLACFDTPSQVADAVKADFDVEVSRQHVYAYDPKSSQRVGHVFHARMAEEAGHFAFPDVAAGIADKMIRLAMLDRMAHHTMANNQTSRTAALLEQAAKECGGIYESRRPMKVPAS